MIFRHGVTKRTCWLTLGVIVACALFLRLYQSEARPLHSDEGVNWHFLQEISRTGIYPYSHENYHGPAYFWLSYGLTRITGESVLGLRLAATLPGLLLCLVPLLVRRKQGFTFCLCAAALTAVSPAMVFHSRYGIHEMLFLFFSAGFALSAYRLFDEHQPGMIAVAVLCLTGLVATKETYVISIAVLAVASLVFGSRWLHAARVVVVRHREALFRSIIAGAFLCVLVFSSGFRSFHGVREIFLSVPQWIGRGVKSDPGHFKPFAYYISKVVWPTEPYLPLALLAGIFFILTVFFFGWYRHSTHLRPDRLRFGAFLLLWSLGITLAYSAVPYKTPWLVINIVLPAVYFTAWLVAALLDGGRLAKFAGGAALAGVMTLALYNTVKFNYDGQSLPRSVAGLIETAPYGDVNPFSYVYTSKGTLELVEDIKRYWLRHPGAKVLVGTSGYWPLPYYLRERGGQAGYFKPDDPQKYTAEYDIIVVDHTNRWENPEWAESNPAWPEKYLRLSDVTEAYIYFKPQ